LIIGLIALPPRAGALPPGKTDRQRNRKYNQLHEEATHVLPALEKRPAGWSMALTARTFGELIINPTHALPGAIERHPRGGFLNLRKFRAPAQITVSSQPGAMAVSTGFAPPCSAMFFTARLSARPALPIPSLKIP